MLQFESSVSVLVRFSDLYSAVDSSREKSSSGHSERRHAALVPQQSLGADHVVHAPHLHRYNHQCTEEKAQYPHISHPKLKPCPYPERAIIGGTEHFGLIRGRDDSQGIHCAHVARQCPHLLFRLNVPNLIHRERGEITILTMSWHFQVSQTITSLQGVVINITYMNEVLVGATNYMMIGDCNGVHTASRGLEHMDTLQRTDVPDLRGNPQKSIHLVTLDTKLCTI